MKNVFLLCTVFGVVSCFLSDKQTFTHARLGVNKNGVSSVRTSRLYEQRKQTSGYKDSGLASKGFVSSLTNIVNSLGFDSSTEKRDVKDEGKQPPRSPEELMERIRDDYTVRNYLWTGDIDLSAFDEQCRFTDPTLSFTGTDQFVKNIQNLRPIVNALVCEGRSELLDIQLDNEFIQTRWNMVGELALPWKPRIDVVGRTKFWFESSRDDLYRIVFYDEEWEIPAGRALLQLVTPAGTIRISTVD